jgi:hypothetical protein
MRCHRVLGGFVAQGTAQTRGVFALRIGLVLLSHDIYAKVMIAVQLLT